MNAPLVARWRTALLCRHALPGLLLLLAALAYFSPVWSSSGMFAGSDIRQQFFYWHSFFHSELLEFGRFPLWDPYTFGGRPFFAGLQPALLYPLTWLYLLPSYPLALHLNLMLNLAGAAFFAYLFIVRVTGDRAAGLAAGIIYAFSGFTLTRLMLGHVSIVNVLPWLPLLFFGIERLHDGWRPGMVTLALATALIFFAGQPQIAFYSLAAAGAYALAALGQPGWHGRRRAKLLAVAGGLLVGLLLAAAQLLPTLEMLQHSSRRAAGMEWRQVVYQSLVPLHVPQFIVPAIYGTIPEHTYFWQLSGYEEVNEYVGVIALLLAVIGVAAVPGWRKYFFGGLALFALLAAMGQHLQFYRWLHLYVPGFGLFRWPIRLLALFAFSAAMLAGLGLARLRSGALSGAAVKRWQHRLCGLLLAALLAAPLLLALRYEQHAVGAYITARAEESYHARGPQHARPWEYYAEKIPVVVAAAIRALLRSWLFFAAGSLLLWLCLRWPQRQRLIGGGLLVLLFCDLFSVARPYFNTVAMPDAAAMRELAGPVVVPGHTRYLSLSSALPANAGMIIRREELGGYDPFINAGYFEMLRALDRDGRVDENAPLQEPLLESRVWPALGLAAVIADSGGRPALLAPASPPQLRYQLAAGTVTLTSFAPGLIELDCNVPATGENALHIAQTWFPGWQAEMATPAGLAVAPVLQSGDRAGDGVSLPTAMVQNIPAGTTHITLRYQPDSFRIGIILSLLGALALLLIALPRRPQSGGPVAEAGERC